MSSPITTHVLDTSMGRPGRGVPVQLEALGDDGIFREIARGTTNDDGRVPGLFEGGTLERRTYRIRFDLEAYFAKSQRASFYPEASIVFRIEAPAEHYHVPLLLSPFGYSTYRGS